MKLPQYNAYHSGMRSVVKTLLALETSCNFQTKGENLTEPAESVHRSRSPLSSKRLSSHDNSANVSDSAESVFRERRGLERPPPPVDVVAETPNVTASVNDSLNSSTASQVG